MKEETPRVSRAWAMKSKIEFKRYESIFDCELAKSRRTKDCSKDFELESPRY
jgi:hypothetical protein